MKKYGLQLRIPPGQSKKPAAAPSKPAPVFSFDDDEEDVEREISRQAAKNKAALKTAEQHKKALEEDPSVFDYDGVYDDMKEKIARPRLQVQAERKSKYIETLMQKAKEREREHEVVYEKKLLKERSKDDHLYADKEKFVTGAYKKKLAEQAKWLEEERLRQIREEKEDVTKKSDLSEFYFSLSKNIAFGAGAEETKKIRNREIAEDALQATDGTAETSTSACPTKDKERVVDRAETSPHSEQPHSESEVPKLEPATEEAPSNQGNEQVELELANQATNERYKRSDDALAAARERFLARKRAKIED